MQETTPNPLMSFLPLLIFSFFMGFVSWALAKEKGRNVIKWTVLGFIPIINMFCMPFFIGAANLRIERKIEAMMETLKAVQSSK
jgi:uncharacterized membrane protein